MKQRAVLAILLVFLGCCSNVYFLEHLIKYAPGSGNIVTFCQFLMISIQGFIFTSKFGTEKPKVPLRNYAALVTLFFMVGVTNNMALNFKIPMPLHMIFRSGSLMANMALGIIILKRKYTPIKFIAVGMITVGIVLCTLFSVKNEGKTKSVGDTVEYFWWLVGVSLLTFALFVSARLGIMQEQIAMEYGKHPRESLFYSHALPLPGFLLLASDIYKHGVLFSQSDPVLIPYIDISIPIMWLYLIGNLITHVYDLTVEYTSLTVTLVITLRKFISLLISIFYFRNPFTIYHWAGTALVFGGSLLFVDIISMFKKSGKDAKEEKKKAD
eukprot:gene2292-17907_t